MPAMSPLGMSVADPLFFGRERDALDREENQIANGNASYAHKAERRRSSPRLPRSSPVCRTGWPPRTAGSCPR